MFGLLLSKEIRAHVQTFRFGAALVTTFLLIVISVWVLGEDYTSRKSTYEKLSDKHALDSQVIYAPSLVSPVLLRPPSALSIFAQGEDSRLGNMVQVTRWQVPDSAQDGHTNNILLRSLQSFDLLSIFVLVISLFGVLLSYDAFSGEKERGTLKLVTLYGPSRGLIFSVKFVAGIIVLSLPFLISFISALLILQLVLGVTFNSAQWFALSLMVLSGLLYGAFFIVAGLFSSTLFARSSTSLVMSLMIWALGVLLIPTAAENVVSMFYNLFDPEEINKFVQTTRQDVLAQQDQLREKYSNSDRFVWGYWSIGREFPWLFDADPVTFRNTAEYTRSIEPLWQERAEKIWDLERSHNERKKQQAGLISALSFASPAQHLRSAFTALAGTDYAGFESFLKETQRFRRALLDEFEKRGYFGRNINQFFSRKTWDEINSREKYDQRVAEYQRREAEGEKGMDIVDFRKQPPLQIDLIPAFEYKGGLPNLEEAIWPMIFLSLFVAVGFVAGISLFIRYDVR